MKNKEKYSVFLVDDDTKHLLLLKDYLHKHSPYPLEVKIFSSGENCLQKLTDKPDVIVLDYSLDGINPKAQNGLEILKQIKNEAPETEVLMMSQQDKIDVAVNSYNYGARDYVIKNESGFLRTQLILSNIINEHEKNKKLEDYRAGSRITSVLIVVLMIVIAILVYLTL